MTYRVASRIFAYGTHAGFARLVQCGKMSSDHDFWYAGWLGPYLYSWPRKINWTAVVVRLTFGQNCVFFFTEHGTMLGKNRGTTGYMRNSSKDTT